MYFFLLHRLIGRCRDDSYVYSNCPTTIKFLDSGVYLRFHKGRGKLSLATIVLTHGGQTMFSYFFYGEFFAKGQGAICPPPPKYATALRIRPSTYRTHRSSCVALSHMVNL